MEHPHPMPRVGELAKALPNLWRRFRPAVEEIRDSMGTFQGPLAVEPRLVLLQELPAIRMVFHGRTAMMVDVRALGNGAEAPKPSDAEGVILVFRVDESERLIQEARLLEGLTRQQEAKPDTEPVLNPPPPARLQRARQLVDRFTGPRGGKVEFVAHRIQRPDGWMGPCDREHLLKPPLGHQDVVIEQTEPRRGGPAQALIHAFREAVVRRPPDHHHLHHVRSPHLPQKLQGLGIRARVVHDEQTAWHGGVPKEPLHARDQQIRTIPREEDEITSGNSHEGHCGLWSDKSVETAARWIGRNHCIRRAQRAVGTTMV